MWGVCPGTGGWGCLGEKPVIGDQAAAGAVAGLTACGHTGPIVIVVVQA